MLRVSAVIAPFDARVGATPFAVRREGTDEMLIMAPWPRV